jgi:hypothetical protein
MALCAVHFLLRKRVVLWQTKFGFRWTVAFKAGGGVFAGIHDELTQSATRGDVKASRPVAGFAAALPDGARVIQPNASVRARGENTGDIRVAFGTGFISHEGCAGDFRGES